MRTFKAAFLGLLFCASSLALASPPFSASGVQISEQAASPIIAGQQGLWTPNAGGFTGKPLWRLSGGSDLSMAPSLGGAYTNGGTQAQGQLITLTAAGQGIVVDIHGAALTYNPNTAGGGSGGVIPTWGSAFAVVDFTQLSGVNGATPEPFFGVNQFGQLFGNPVDWERQDFHFPGDSDTIFIIDPSVVIEGGALISIAGSTAVAGKFGGDRQDIAGNGPLGGGLYIAEGGIASAVPATGSITIPSATLGGVYIATQQSSTLVLGRKDLSTFSSIMYGGSTSGISLISAGPFAIQTGAGPTTMFSASAGGNVVVGPTGTPAGVGTTIQAGSFGVNVASPISFSSDATFFTHANPNADNALALGTGVLRWAQVWSYIYAGNTQTINSSGAITVSRFLGSSAVVTATGNVTSLSVNVGLPDQRFILLLVQNGGGTATWPTTIGNVLLPGGTFTKTTTASAIDRIDLVSDGTQWYATSLFANLH